MTPILTKGKDLHAALAGGDMAGLELPLTVDFQGQLSQGVPHGLGRLYDGRAAMIDEGWASVGRWFDMSPHVDELIDGGKVLVGRGNYVGTAKANEKPISAAFAHFWQSDGEAFSAVRQVTDSGVWRDALA